jgi:hypothetical protein
MGHVEDITDARRKKNRKTPKVLKDLFSGQEWGKLEKIANESGKIYLTAHKAKKHADKL